MENFQFNRFPLCSLFYYEAAKMLGYSEEESKSLAQGRAAFFAAAKLGFKQKTTLQELPTAQVNTIDFAGLAAFTIDTPTGFLSCTKNGDSIHQPATYDKSELRIEKAVGTEGLAKIRNFIQEQLSKLGSDLNSDKVYKLYAKHRDFLRTVEFQELQYA
jgi:hypothetical protein